MPDTRTTVGDLARAGASNVPIGRFAPSPTGDLHFGSLLAAMASYCQVKQSGGIWQLRIDDIDGPRSVPGSADAIKKTLLQYGLEWDGAIHWQQDRIEHYLDALRKLIARRCIFACSCSRRSLGNVPVYPGKCRHRLIQANDSHSHPHIPDHALRCRLTGEVIFQDNIQGSQHVDLDANVGDSIIWRRDNLVSYTLACALDDAENATEVVRGADLLSSTSTQIAIMQILGLPVPSYAHIPVAIDQNGDKLSKHSKAMAISKQTTMTVLRQAWRFLGQNDFEAQNVVEFWQLATIRWQLSAVPAVARKSL